MLVRIGVMNIFRTHCDAPVVAQARKQGEHPIKTKEAQLLLLTFGELYGESGLILLGLASKSSHLVTLIS